VEGGALIEDLIVQAGGGDRARELSIGAAEDGGQDLRGNHERPRWRTFDDTRRPDPLSVAWTVERLFYDLKVVLDLERFYAANPNAVAMQVFAAAMVHVAFRLGQADLAKRIGRPPEDFSPKKLYPFLATTSMTLIEAAYYFQRIQEANPRPSFESRIGPPTLLPSSLVRYLLVQKRSAFGRRRTSTSSAVSGSPLQTLKGPKN